MTNAKRIITVGPATHPSWPMAHAKERTPEPITAVIICDEAVQKVPQEPRDLLLDFSIPTYNNLGFPNN